MRCASAVPGRPLPGEYNLAFVHQRNMKDWLERLAARGADAIIPRIICSEALV
jgi:hypothetical protein